MIPERIRTDAELDEALVTPNAADIATLSQLPGDVIIVGAGGKMGPTLATRVRRAADAAGQQRRVFAASRFSDPAARQALEREGVHTIACDLTDRAQITALPSCDHVPVSSGQKVRHNRSLGPDLVHQHRRPRTRRRALLDGEVRRLFHRKRLSAGARDQQRVEGNRSAAAGGDTRNRASGASASSSSPLTNVARAHCSSG